MRILVLGAGGIGGYFGGRMAEAGLDVTFLVRPGRRAQLERDGLRIASTRGNVQMPVRTVLATDLAGDFDLVLLTCKAYDLESAIESISPAMNGRCVLVPLLNGLDHFPRLDERFGRPAVIGGTCSINVTLHPDGTIQHTGALQRLVFGARDGSQPDRVRQLADALAATTIDWALSDDIDQDLWEKIYFLSALAATTCLFRANVGEIMAAPGGRDAMDATLSVNAQIAACEGREPRRAAVEFARRGLTDASGTWSASMLRDLEAGGRVESDHIIGWMLERARRHGIEATLLSLAYTHLKAYEARRAGARLPAAQS